jgi:succinate dehydrogenase/fumarate reductase flavoprotein subunit
MFRSDGSLGVYPHLVERGKPGVIAVQRNGRRFCDEAVSYHDFVEKWLGSSAVNGPVEAWLICDRCFLWRYGLGAVKPGGFNALSAWRKGYLNMGSTLNALAQQCGIEARGLEETVKAYNDHLVKDGEDPLFWRGKTSYDRSQGDSAVQPNPCLAPICDAPYFAVRLYPGCLGTFAGLATDASARVLNAEGDVIEGLYACGNDMASAFGGFYPSSGMTLGAAMTFGFMVGSHAANASGHTSISLPLLAAQTDP